MKVIDKERQVKFPSKILSLVKLHPEIFGLDEEKEVLKSRSFLKILKPISFRQVIKDNREIRDYCEGRIDKETFTRFSENHTHQATCMVSRARIGGNYSTKSPSINRREFLKKFPILNPSPP